MSSVIILPIYGRTRGKGDKKVSIKDNVSL
jgi:hypothetical protein